MEAMGPWTWPLDRMHFGSLFALLVLYPVFPAPFHSARRSTVYARAVIKLLSSQASDPKFMGSTIWFGF